MVRDDVKITAVSRALLDAGIYLNPIRYPAVKSHQSRLRISVSAEHELEDLSRAAGVIGSVLRRHGVIR
jgi:glycine C-acetyltransferase